MDVFLKCLRGFGIGAILLLLAVGLYCLVGNALGYALFRTVFSGVGYDTALPLSIAVSFGIMLAVVVAVYFGWRKWKRSRR
jgi:hypothetical protein